MQDDYDYLKSINNDDLRVGFEDFYARTTAWDLLHGKCDIVAMSISIHLSYHNIPHRLERLDYKNKRPDQVGFAHDYVVIKDVVRDKECYADIRGISYDKDQFMKHFVEFEKELGNIKSKDDLIVRRFPKEAVCTNLDEFDETDWEETGARQLFETMIDSDPTIITNFIKSQEAYRKMQSMKNDHEKELVSEYIY